jgi:hypothetical protein
MIITFHLIDRLLLQMMTGSLKNEPFYLRLINTNYIKDSDFDALSSILIMSSSSSYPQLIKVVYKCSFLKYTI